MTYFLEAGDSGVSDDVSADITYYDFSGSYIKDRPKEITVTGDGKTYRKRTATYGTSGNLETLTSEKYKGRILIIKY